MPRKRKKLSLGKILKIVGGVIVFLTLPTLLFFAFLYIKYDEELPQGKQGPEADLLAQQMLDALDYEAYEQTDYLEWTFRGSHRYQWNKTDQKCIVRWKDYKVDLNFKDLEKSMAYVHNFRVYNENANELIYKAYDLFNNDSYWLIAPYKVFDDGVVREILSTTSGNALKVTFTSGGSTPGDSYVWYLNKDKRPTSYKMWVSILPIDGLEASWNHWTTTESGAILPTYHKILFFGIPISGIVGTNIR